MTMGDKEKSFDVTIDEILSSYNHKAKDHLEFDEMFSLVKDVVSEIDPNFDETDEAIEKVIL